ncbi:hypothetical protein ACKUV4_018335 [Acinetobacter baumannii]
MQPHSPQLYQLQRGQAQLRRHLLRTGLGLGNAAQGTLTTSTFDSNVGRILRIGDFGLGSSPITQAGLTLDPLSGASHFGLGDRLFSGYGHGYIMIGGPRPAILGLYNGILLQNKRKT